MIGSIQNCGIKADEAPKIASVLGIKYSAQNLIVTLPVAAEPQSVKPIGLHCGDITAITVDIANQIRTKYRRTPERFNLIMR